MLSLGKAVDDSGLEKRLTELVKLRVSQINHCAFCLQFHLNIARRLRIDPIKLDLLATWRDAGVFDARERAALAWAESLTLCSSTPVDDLARSMVLTHFSRDEFVFLTATIGSINSWNRLGAGLGFAPPPPLKQAAA